jgi:hypothetical protein
MTNLRSVKTIDLTSDNDVETAPFMGSRPLSSAGETVAVKQAPKQISKQAQLQTQEKQEIVSCVKQ